MRPERRSVPALVAGLLLAIAGHPARGAAVFDDFTTFAEAGWASNVTDSSTDPQSETMAAVGIEGRATTDLRQSGLDAMFDLSYLEFLGGEYSGRLTGNASLEGRLAVVPDRLWVVVTDSFGQTQTDPFAPATIQNQENTNVAAGGLDTRLDLAGNLVFLGSGRYIIESYQRTAADNERWQGAAGVHYEFSGRSSLGALAQARDVNFSEDSPYDDFSVREYLLRYRIEAPRTSMQLDGGWSEYHGRDAMQSRRNMWAARVQVARTITSRTRATLALGREISDGGNLFVGALDRLSEQEGRGHASLSAAPTIGAGVVATGNALKSTYLGGELEVSMPRSSLSIGAEARRERYLGVATVDRNAYAARLGLSRSLSTRLSMSLDASGTMREVAATDASVEDYLIGLGAQYRAGPRTTFGLTFEYFEQAGSFGFHDRRAWARVSYSPISARQR